ncbi:MULTISPECIES: hypothetical protein [Cyanophyceae]|uniref:hypothetical protein n=1 Tax=Cyanophyceae TaxID=3028117 RepID=UPI001684783C|nr:hypothetical protein [Trichocoleus sp. FACHB-69]MBD1930314.1 hypothetical protein [Trichocoleus sp. FACHB-69]
MEVVFRIEAVISAEPNCWHVAGRAYANITVGDIVLAQLDPISNNGDFTYLTVIAISTYGRSIDRLDRMLTGMLTVKGSEETDLSMVPDLYRRTSED